MRNVVVIASTVCFSLLVGSAACSSDEDASPSPAAPDGGRSSGSSSGVGVDGSSACKQGEKLCSDNCVGLDDPKTGCGGDLCDPCPATTGANTVPACLAGVCKPGCAQGFGDCNKNADDGCETPVSANLAHCGKCGNACGTAHAGSAPKCAAGKCEFTCEAGWKNCGPDSEGCNKNVDSDPKNCGACGRDCLGGTCAAGQCSIIPLATGQATPNALAVDANNVYFVNGGNGKLMRMGKDGSGLADGLAGATLTDPRALVTDGQRLVWSNYNANAAVKLQRANVNGSGIADVGDSFGTFAGGLAISGNTIAWTNRSGTNRVVRAPAAGGAAVVVATGNVEPAGVAVDATHVYWGSGANGNLHRQPLAAAAPCTIGTNCPELAPVQAFNLAVDATNLYFTQAAAVSRIAKGGGAVAAIATNQASPLAIAIDAKHVYWSAGGSIRRALLGAATPCDGAACEIVVDGASASDMVLDDKAIYWTDGAGTVNKRAK